MKRMKAVTLNNEPTKPLILMLLIALLFQFFQCAF
jgi:hypothetical protein